jgi:predicted TIM-barrel fold metal-dependent hydrolase
LPQVIWGLDNNYQLLRFESPNLKRWPSEYIREHVRFSTQPIEESQDDKQALAKLLATVEGVDDMICYSSDYPHISYDDPSYVSKLIPAAWHRKVFCENACRLFGWKLPAPEADLPVLAEA